MIARREPIARAWKGAASKLIDEAGAPVKRLLGYSPENERVPSSRKWERSRRLCRQYSTEAGTKSRGSDRPRTVCLSRTPSPDLSFFLTLFCSLHLSPSPALSTHPSLSRYLSSWPSFARLHGESALTGERWSGLYKRECVTSGDMTIRYDRSETQEKSVPISKSLPEQRSGLCVQATSVTSTEKTYTETGNAESTHSVNPFGSKAGSLSLAPWFWSRLCSVNEVPHVPSSGRIFPRSCATVFRVFWAGTPPSLVERLRQL